MARQIINNDANNLLGVLAMIAEMRARKDQSAKEENRFNLQYKQGETNQQAMLKKIEADLALGREKTAFERERMAAEAADRKTQYEQKLNIDYLAARNGLITSAGWKDMTPEAQKEALAAVDSAYGKAAKAVTTTNATTPTPTNGRTEWPDRPWGYEDWSGVEDKPMNIDGVEVGSMAEGVYPSRRDLSQKTRGRRPAPVANGVASPYTGMGDNPELVRALMGL